MSDGSSIGLSAGSVRLVGTLQGNRMHEDEVGE